MPRRMLPVINNIWFRRVFRGARMVGLGFGVFVAGKYNGYMEHARNPKECDRIQLFKFLHAREVQMRLQDGHKVRTSMPYVRTVLTERKPKHKLPSSPTAVPAFTHHERGAVLEVEASPSWGEHALQLERVGTKIVHAAREVCDMGIQWCETTQDPERREAYRQSLDEEHQELFDRIGAMELDAETWASAQSSLGYRWEAFMVEASEINAFFTPLLPHSIFVHEGLVAACENDDELAHVLGHEMSHMICGHIENMLQFNAIVLLSQMVVLAMLDPTGTLSFGGELAMYVGNKLGLLNAAYSRQNETQADDLGLLIAARACYDTKRAMEFFAHLRQHETGPQTPTSYLDTHPADLERVINLASAAEAMHSIVDHSSCAPTATAQEKFLEALGIKKG